MDDRNFLYRRNVFELIQATYSTQTLFVLTKLGIFDQLYARPTTLQGIQKSTPQAGPSLATMVQIGQSTGYLRETDGVYSLTTLGLTLAQKTGSWLRPYLLVWGDQLNPAFSELYEAMNATSCDLDCFKRAHGDSIWDLYRKNLKQQENFLAFMSGVTAQAHIPAILSVSSKYFSTATTLLDVGGGEGALATALCLRHNTLHATIFDSESNRLGAEGKILASDLRSRCKFISGDFFECVPKGMDLYIIKHVLHDWNDEAAVKILRNVHSAMSYDSKLIIIEGISDRVPSNNDFDSLFLHTRTLEQKVWTQGKVRSHGEFSRLTSEVGFQIDSIEHSTIFDLSYIQCTKSVGRE